MHDALKLLDALDADDLDWIFRTGVERQVLADGQIVREDAQPTAISIVLEGLVRVTVSSMGGQVVARLGPGELFGEMAFLTGDPATATVSAEEATLLLEIPYAALRQQAEADTAFAARLYRALALIENRRLQRAVRSLGQLWISQGKTHSERGGPWAEMAARIDAFQELMAATDKEALRNDDTVPDDQAERVVATFSQLSGELDAMIGDGSSLSEQVRGDLGHRAQREVLPYLLMSEIGERIYAKPRGYAGDYLTIELMYRDRAEGHGRLGPVMDRACRAQPANRAVVNRRALLSEELMATIAATEQPPTRVTSLAAGPAAELFDVFAALEDPTRLKATCIDIDLQALAFVGDKSERLKLRRQFELVNGNLVYLASGRQKLELPPQDLIYSIGLIDYFSDKFVGMLLNYIHDRLRPGGRVLLGNFHPNNPNKALMDHVFEWKLIHRDEADMDRLFAASAFDSGCTRMRLEEQGVNLFAECVRRA